MAYRPDRKGGFPTIRDVAARAGVSTATVSNVLNGSRYVGPERRQQVMDAIGALGYRPNGIAASLRSQRTKVIGVVVPDITSAFFGSIIHRIETLAAGSGYQIMLVSSNEDPVQERDRLRALLSRRADGLIIIPTGDMFEGRDDIIAESVNAVIVDRGEGLPEFDTISADNWSAAYEGTRHLLELGHRDIALLASTTELANMRSRIAGYQDAMREAGAAARECVVLGGLTVESARAAIEPMLRPPTRPSAIFAVNSVATLGAIRAIRALGLDFPRDISLLGFDDLDWMTVLKPYVSTVRQPVDQMADLAWRLLIDRIGGRRDQPARVRLPCSLCVRDSTQHYQPAD